MTTISRVGEVTTAFGESPHWDDRRQRLYFVDCVGSAVLWLEPDGECRSLATPSMPTGLVLTEGDEIVVVCEDGLYNVDVDRSAVELLAPNPDGITGRFNDAAADDAGNIVVGSLNFAPGPGSLWRFSSASGWTHLADDLANVNGPAHVNGDLLVADSLAATIYRFSYDAKDGTVSDRRVFAKTDSKVGPDGATVDADGCLWSAMFAGSRVVRYDNSGDEVGSLDLPFSHPTMPAFGGPDLDVMYVTTVSDTFGGKGDLAGALVAISDTGFRGRPDPRFRS